ncbi:DcrB-related protein [Paenibacillus ottowii]
MLSVADKGNKNVGLVFRIPKAAYASNTTLDEFVQQREEASTLGLENFRAVETTPIQIDSTTARTADYSGKFNGQQVYYFSAMLESKQHYFQVLIYSRGGSAVEKHHEFATIASSLKILSDSQVKSDLRSTTILKTFKSEDAQQQIRLPYVWKTGLILNPDALIQAWYEKNDAYMAIIKDWKSELPYEKSSMITLKDYAEFSAQLVLKRAGKGIILTGPIKVNINGNQGLQYEVWVENDKVKIMYLITFFEHTDSFSQIIFCTRADYYDSQKSEFQRYFKTYREIEI